MNKEEQSNGARNLQLLKEKLLRRLPEPGRYPTAIEGLTITRRNEVNEPENCFYTPTVGMVVQGFKRSMIGNEEYRYGENYCLAVGVDMPSVNTITDASPEKPFLAVALKLNRYFIAQLAAETPPPAHSGNMSYRGVALAQVDDGVLDCFLRLVELLDKPEQIPLLAPMIIREIHGRMLLGPQGECLRMFSTLGTQSNQIAQAISWLRANYIEPLMVDDLSQRVNMATSTFNRHFRQVTTLSPLQFQKRLRLYEAQRLMLVSDKDASSAALAVGYESATQFNREYKRMFGEPPHRDVSRLRNL
jgi:AraC-like DNA-binding protein